MIVLKETGQFATFFDRYRVDRPRNACQLFWYTLGASAVFTGAGVVAGLTLIGWVMWFFPGPLHPAEAVAMIVTLVGIIIGVMIYHDRRGIPNPKLLVRPQWRENIATGYEGFKEKFCPIINYKETS